MNYVEELRKQDEARGITSRHTSWTEKGYALDEQEKARIQLAMNWRISQGYYASIRCMDSMPVRRQLDVSTMRWKVSVQWHRFLPWIRDRVDELICETRLARDYFVRNPFGDL